MLIDFSRSRVGFSPQRRELVRTAALAGRRLASFALLLHTTWMAHPSLHVLRRFRCVTVSSFCSSPWLA